jgi:hypothetical protein
VSSISVSRPSTTQPADFVGGHLARDTSRLAFTDSDCKTALAEMWTMTAQLSPARDVRQVKFKLLDLSRTS